MDIIYEILVILSGLITRAIYEWRKQDLINDKENKDFDWKSFRKNYDQDLILSIPLSVILVIVPFEKLFEIEYIKNLGIGVEWEFLLIFILSFFILEIFELLRMRVSKKIKEEGEK